MALSNSDSLEDLSKKISVYLKTIDKILTHYENTKKHLQEYIESEATFTCELQQINQSYINDTVPSQPLFEFTAKCINVTLTIQTLLSKTGEQIMLPKSDYSAPFNSLKNLLNSLKQRIAKEATELEKECNVSKKLYEQSCLKLDDHCDIIEKNLIDQYNCRARENLENKIIDTHKKSTEYQTRYKIAVEKRNEYFDKTNTELTNFMRTFETQSVKLFSDIFDALSIVINSCFTFPSVFKDLRENIKSQSEKLSSKLLVFPKFTTNLIECSSEIVKLNESQFLKLNPTSAIFLTAFQDIKLLVSFISQSLSEMKNFFKTFSTYANIVVNYDEQNIRKLEGIGKKATFVPYQSYVPSYMKNWGAKFEYLLKRNIDIKNAHSKILKSCINLTAQPGIDKYKFSHSYINKAIEELISTVSKNIEIEELSIKEVTLCMLKVETSSIESNETKLHENQKELIVVREKQEEIKNKIFESNLLLLPRLHDIILQVNQQVLSLNEYNCSYIQSFFTKIAITSEELSQQIHQCMPSLNDILVWIKDTKTDTVLKEIISHYNSNYNCNLLGEHEEEFKSSAFTEDNRDGYKSRQSILKPLTVPNVAYKEHISQHTEMLQAIKNSNQDTNEKGDWFNKKFKLLSDEIVNEESYPCAVQLKIIIQGRLYITSKRVCFHSYFNDSFILLGETKMSIPYEEIISIKKKKKALIFHNSIEIEIKGKAYFFMSFFNRNEVYAKLEAAIQNRKAINENGGSDDSSNSAKSNPFKSSEEEAFREFNDRIAVIEKERRELFKSKNLLIADENTGIVITDETYDCPIQLASIDINNPSKSGRFFTKVFNEVCGNYDFEFKPIDGAIPSYFYSYKNVIKNIYKRYIQNHSFSELNSASEWNLITKSSIKCHHKLGGGVPFLPKQCTVEQDITFYWISPNSFYIDTIAHSKGVPKSDIFHTWNGMYITQMLSLDEKGINMKTRIVNRFKMVFTGSTILKGQIESTGIADIKKSVGNQFPGLLRKFISEEMPKIDKLIDSEEGEKIIRCRYEFPSIESSLIKKAIDDARPMLHLENKMLTQMQSIVFAFTAVIVYFIIKIYFH